MNKYGVDYVFKSRLMAIMFILFIFSSVLLLMYGFWKSILFTNGLEKKDFGLFFMAYGLLVARHLTTSAFSKILSK